MQSTFTTSPKTAALPLQAGNKVTAGGYEYTIVAFVEWDVAEIRDGVQYFAPVYQATNGFDGIETMAFHAI